jgi:MFS family permease
MRYALRHAETLEAPRRTSPFQALRIRDYRWYWFSGLGMTGAQNIQRLAMSWLILDLTGSLGQLGLMIFLMGLPMTLTSLWGGVLADRYDRRMILTLSQAFTSVNLAILALLTVTDLVHPAHIYVSSMEPGVMQALTMPARNALWATWSGRRICSNAVSLNDSDAVRPGSLALVGRRHDCALRRRANASASAALSFSGMLCLQVVRATLHERSQKYANQLRELVNGLKYCLSTPRISALTSMGLLNGCFGLGYSHVAPGYSREVLGFDAGATGVFLMAIGIGSIIGSLLMLVVPVRDGLRTYFLGSAGLGLSIVLMAASPWALLALVPNAMFGIFLAIMIVNGQTVIQTEVPANFLGRVTSVWTIAGGLGLAASLPVGALGEEFGLRYVLIGTGLAVILCALANGTLRASVLRQREVSTATV